jgi:hypothetical protein
MSTTGNLQGSVTMGGSPIANAKVFVSGGALRTWTTVTTDANGVFHAGWLPFGSYAITATAPGGATVRQDANVQIGVITAVNLSN